MPITPFLKGRAFRPEVLRNMGTAFVAVCQNLELNDGADRLHEVVAHKIIALAEKGVSDPGELRDRALEEIKAR